TTVTPPIVGGVVPVRAVGANVWIVIWLVASPVFVASPRGSNPTRPHAAAATSTTACIPGSYRGTSSPAATERLAVRTPAHSTTHRDTPRTASYPSRACRVSAGRGT